MTRQRPPSNALSRVLRWAAGHTDTAKERPTRRRAPRTHIILIDGTLSTLKEGRETHIGWLYKQLGQSTMTTSVHYIPGLQWGNWRTSWRVLVGRGLSAQIQKAYGYWPRATDRVIRSICLDIPVAPLRSDRFLGLLIALGYCGLNLPQHAMWTVCGGVIADRGDQKILNHATVMGMSKST